MEQGPKLPPGEPTNADVNVPPVNHSAGLDPSLDPGAGMPPSDDPYGDALAIRGLFKAVNNDMVQMNEHLVGEASGLKRQSVNKARMDADILNLMGQKPAQAPPQQFPQQQVPQPVQENFPQQSPTPQPQEPSQENYYDPNQLELNFDNSATAKGIDEKLFNLEEKVRSNNLLLKKILKLLESDTKKK